MMFKEIIPIDSVAENILKKRYYQLGETTWKDIVERVVSNVLKDCTDKDRVELTKEMLLNRYFIPNSPCLVNAGKANSGLIACFTVDLKDTIEEIYKTKLDFAMIARKGGGCGTSLSKIRPEGSKVSGSAHGYAGGPIKFADTISHDMDALSQSGMRPMAMLMAMSIYHPDILKFIHAKDKEGKLANANISVLVDDAYMQKVENDEEYQTYFDFESGRVYYDTYKARDVFNEIVDCAWNTGEPGILHYDTINNNSPYKYAGEEITTTNPCITGDTKILTVYEGAVPIKQLAELRDDVLVYCWDSESKLPVVRVMHNPRLTRENAEIVKVTFDSGLEVKCTPDHNFYTFRGEKIRADELKEGQSVRAYSVSLAKDGHLRVLGWSNGKVKHQYVARLVWECFNGKIEDNLILHHRDMNKLNNRLENFELLTNSEHSSIHYDKTVKHGFNHKVVSVEYLNELEDVYNGTVDGVHNYVIADNVPVAGVYSGVVSANCGEVPMPMYGSCNLGSLDLSKFVENKKIDLDLLGTAVRLGVRFLDDVIDKTSYPTKEIEDFAKKHRNIGLGVMGLADLFLSLEIAYGSKQSVELTEFIMNFIYKTAEDESIIMGNELGIPPGCESLPIPRRNMTLLSVAPTGSISLLSRCSSGCEPIFSEVTTRVDKTGTYILKNKFADLDYFRCAVSGNGCQEVTWQEHLNILKAVQKYVDAGVSKTVNVPNHTHRETIFNIFMEAWKTKIIKGITVYRNGSRNVEVLSPKNVKKDKFPLCSAELISSENCKKCNKCDFSSC